jgi:hypothetical protein
VNQDSRISTTHEAIVTETSRHGSTALVTKVPYRGAKGRRNTSTPALERRFEQNPWRHVPLADLFCQARNTLRARANGKVTCGHEPRHGSRFGTCVSIDA